jgi:hypothetical protein
VADRLAPGSPVGLAGSRALPAVSARAAAHGASLAVAAAQVFAACRFTCSPKVPRISSRTSWSDPPVVSLECEHVASASHLDRWPLASWITDDGWGLTGHGTFSGWVPNWAPRLGAALIRRRRLTHRWLLRARVVSWRLATGITGGGFLGDGHRPAGSSSRASASRTSSCTPCGPATPSRPRTPRGPAVHVPPGFEPSAHWLTSPPV